MTGVQPPSFAGAPSLPATAALVVATAATEGFARLPIGGRVVARVAAAGPSGHVQLQTPFGALSVRASVPLKPGADVHLALQSSTPHLRFRIVAVSGDPGVEGPPRPTPATPAAPISPAPPAPAGSAQTSIAPALPAAMATLREALETLRAANPGIAARVADHVLPQANSSLAARILFMIRSVRGGDVGSWLGEAAARSVRWADPELATRLAQAFPRLEQAAEERAADPWRVLHIPLLADGELTPVRLLTVRRRRNGDADDADDPPGARFVVDIRLSRLGRLQLDGLVRRASRRLDLIVRSDAPLPATMEDDIREIFAEAGSLTGLRGGLAFQTQPAGFVETGVAREPPAHARSGVVV